MIKKNIIFVGGVHGVGKGTICEKICSKCNCNHYSASDILKWQEISSSCNKRVDNVANTQDRLLYGLTELSKKEKQFILDGHFCLINNKEEVERIPLDTFQAINPEVIAVVVENIAVIAERLNKRDGVKYDVNFLFKMQKVEIEYAKEVATILDVPYIEISNGDFSLLTKHIL